MTNNGILFTNITVWLATSESANMHALWNAKMAEGI